MREIHPAATGPARDASVTLLAESLGRGVTANDIRELRRQHRPPAGQRCRAKAIASAAKGLRYRDAKLPVSDGTGSSPQPCARDSARTKCSISVARSSAASATSSPADRRYARCATQSREAIVPSSCSAAAPSPSSASGHAARDARAAGPPRTPGGRRPGNAAAAGKAGTAALRGRTRNATSRDQQTTTSRAAS